MKKQQKKQLKQIENQAQEGRSMVEMLGVLAIIGVLSLGGIAGYRWGMDKHVSNQILYEMNLNSAQLAMLLQKGNPDGVTLSLGSPYDEGKFRTVDYGFAYACGEEASFGHECEYLDETMYSMTATGLPKRVCNMLGDAVFGMAYYYDSEINGGDNECNDTNNTVTVFFDTDTTVEGGIPRPEESETHTPVPEVTEPTTTTATETTTPETTTTEAITEVTTTQATTATLTATIVTTTTFNGECRTNAECKQKYGDGYFCWSSSCSYTCSNSQMTEEESCKNGTYKCKSIGSPSSETIDGTTYYYKQTNMNWWSADRYCKALKAQRKVTKGALVSLGELGCTTTIGTAGCAGDGKLQKALKENGWTSYVWTSTPYNSESENSCGAYYVLLSSGSVGSSLRGSFNYALCE